MSDEEGEMDSKPPRVDKRRKHTKLDDVQLIQLVKAHKALYEADDEDYHNQVRRDEIWQEIGKRMGRKMDECRRRWFNMRDCYRKSILKNRTRSLHGDPTVMHWKYHNEMRFMEPHLKNSKPRRNYGSSLVASEEYPDEDDHLMTVADFQGYAENDTSSPQKVMEFFDETDSQLPEGDAAAASDLHEILQDLAAWRREEQQTKRDHIGTYFKSIEETVRTFPVPLQIEAKKQISAMVFDLELRATTEKQNQ